MTTALIKEQFRKIDELRKIIETAYGHLWHDQTISKRSLAARKTLLAALDKDGQFRGITTAGEQEPWSPKLWRKPSIT